MLYNSVRTWSNSGSTKGGKPGYFPSKCKRLQQVSGTACVDHVHSYGNSREGEDGSCSQVGGTNLESLVLALEQKGGVELEARRRWAVTSHCWRTLWFKVEMSKEVVAT